MTVRTTARRLPPTLPPPPRPDSARFAETDTQTDRRLRAARPVMPVAVTEHTATTTILPNMTAPASPPKSVIELSPPKYTPLGFLGAGGMGTVFLARATGSAGFSRLVALKRLHPHLAAEASFITMLVDEARLTSSLRHVNVMSTLDLVVDETGFSLVLDYVEGGTLQVLQREAQSRGERLPQRIVLALIAGVLRGLDAMHDARGEEGQPLGIVHRDISPANVLVGVDGVPRIIDFGVAKALGRIAVTTPGEVRGKLAYIAPEQLRGRPVTRQADVYGTGIVLWELLTGTRLFKDDERAISAKLSAAPRRPSAVDASIPPALEAIVMKAIAPELGERYFNAREMLDALAPFDRASDDEVGRLVRRLTAGELARRARLISENGLGNGAGSSSAYEIVESGLVATARPSPSALLAAARPSPGAIRIPTPSSAFQPLDVARESTPPAPPPSEPRISVAPPPALSPQYGILFTVAVAMLVVLIGIAFGAVTHRNIPAGPLGQAQAAHVSTPHVVR